jgi:2',3'-cyclic-nucleotide 2'-phosphodiesterase (5'-nucleotidase family)
VIGESRVDLTGYDLGENPGNTSCWGENQARAIQEATQADIGTSFSQFFGVKVPAGPVTFGNLVENFPHTRRFDRAGWRVSTIRVSGLKLKVLLKAMLMFKDTAGIDFSGIEYVDGHYSVFPGLADHGAKPRHLRVNGEPIRNSEKYTLAMPSDIWLVTESVAPKLAQAIFSGHQFAQKYYWDVLKDYVSDNSPINCLNTKMRFKKTLMLKHLQSLDLPQHK